MTNNNANKTQVSSSNYKNKLSSYIAPVLGALAVGAALTYFTAKPTYDMGFNSINTVGSNQVQVSKNNDNSSIIVNAPYIVGDSANYQKEASILENSIDVLVDGELVKVSKK